MMRHPKWLLRGCVAALVFPYAFALAPRAQAQAASPLTFADLMSGDKVPASIPAAKLPDDFRAVKISYTGGGGGDMMGMFMPFMMMGVMMGGASGSGNSVGMAVMSLLGTSWSRGDTVTLGGKEFLIAYAMNFDFMELMARSEANGGEPPFDENTALRLTLIRTDTITSLSPMPDTTKEMLLKTLKAVQDLGTGTTAPATEPATAAPTELDASAAVEPVMSGDPASARAASIRAQAQSNIKQLAISLLMYANDYDDVLPYAQSTTAVKYVTYPYLRQVNVWKSPNPAKVEVRFNMALAGVSMPSIPEPSNTIMLFESKPWPDGRRLVAMADSSTRFVEASEWRRLEASLRLRLPRMGKPLPADWGVREWRDLYERR